MKKRQEGSAMIVVMVVMIVTVVLALTLLLVSSVMMMNATRSNQKEQCRVTAVSVSNVLIEHIKNLGAYTEIPKAHPDGKEDSLKGKLQSVVTTEWYSYDKNASSIEQITKKNKDYYTYELTGTNLPGTTVLDMYWIDESGEQLKELDMNDPEKAASLFQSLKLYLKVTNTVGEESSTIISCFSPIVNTEKTPGVNGEEETDDWKEWFWHYEGHEWERGDS